MVGGNGEPSSSLHCSCWPTAPASDVPPPIAERIGVVSTTQNGSCLSIATSGLRAGARIQVVEPGSRQILTATIGAEQGCTSPGAEAANGYSIRLAGNAPAILVGFGVTGDSEVEARNDGLAADIDGDGTLEFFRMCTSREGVHLTVWTDASVNSRRRWHRYHPLGYDVEPTCTAAEMAAGD